jgi:nitrate reductase beta subunit
VHRLPHLLGDLQERLDQPRRVEYAWFNNVETKPGIGYPKDWENQDRWNGGWQRRADGRIEPRQGGKWRLLAQIFANPHLPEIDDYYEPFTFDYDICRRPAHARDAGGAAALADHRPAHGEDRVGAELGEILGGEFEKRAKDYNFEAVRRRSTGSSRTPS